MSLFFKEFEKFYIFSICFFPVFSLFVSWETTQYLYQTGWYQSLIIFLFKLHWCVSCSVFSPCFLSHTHPLNSSLFSFLSLIFSPFLFSSLCLWFWTTIHGPWKWLARVLPLIYNSNTLAPVQLCPHHFQYTVKCITWHCVIFSSRIYTRSPYLGLHLRQKSSTPSEARPVSWTLEIRPTSWKQDRNLLCHQKSSQDHEPQKTLGHNREHTQSQNSSPKLWLARGHTHHQKCSIPCR